MTRLSVYRHEDGLEATRSQLRAAIAPHKAWLLDKHINMYTSTDFKVGIDSARLEASKAILESLAIVDPRVCFSQDDVYAALMAEIGVCDEMMAISVSEKKTIADIISLMAYYLRVMCSHLREKSEARVSTRASAFDTLSVIMGDRKKRRVWKQANPFIHFRNDEHRQEDAEDDPPRSIVAKWFDTDSMKAMLLWCDGEKMAADTYEEGADGFAIAKWHQVFG